MKKLLIITFMLVAIIGLAACGKKEEPKSNEKKSGSDNKNQTEQTTIPEKVDLLQFGEGLTGTERVVEMVTTMGNIKIMLFPDKAPKTVENFIKHAEKANKNALYRYSFIIGNSTWISV